MKLILDTDIGKDIDDAYALAMIMNSPVELVGRGVLQEGLPPVEPGEVQPNLLKPGREGEQGRKTWQLVYDRNLFSLPPQSQ